MDIVKNRTLRVILFSIGVTALILGSIGAFLPLLPTTPFVLLAAWCFMKSSPKAHQWIYQQPVLGDALRNWENNRAISRRAKIVALASILISAVVMWFKVPNLWLRFSVYLLLATVSIFIATRNEDSRP
ncbi:YbaN family protein [Bdellovibrio sp. HCB2-146]|uniref:YbaN family protein n=1 Tax=Bdellovibrio sp. HCB2-146 TaxID=3394362 RepID=UPI0039BD469D